MFDIGFAELLVVAVMGLIVLGPEKLPTAARTLGLWIGRIRRSVGSIQREISEELRVDELRRKTAVTKEQLDEELRDVSKPFKQPFGDDSPAQKAAPEAPKPEFDPAKFTGNDEVKSAYSKPASESSSGANSANASPEPSVASSGAGTAQAVGAGAAEARSSK